jgi:hypothetical protein
MTVSFSRDTVHKMDVVAGGVEYTIPLHGNAVVPLIRQSRNRGTAPAMRCQEVRTVSGIRELVVLGAATHTCSSDEARPSIDTLLSSVNWARLSAPDGDKWHAWKDGLQ